MIEVAIMIEGQNGLTWQHWMRMAQAVEDLGFVGLYRSDHYTNATPPDSDSLECWVSLAWLASHTKRIEFGPLVSPVSFRHPTMLVRQAAAIDELSGGRLTLGVGAGWQEREHTNYGWELLEIKERFNRFEEGLEVITRLVWHDHPADFQGNYFRLQDAVLLPRPHRPLPILIGGNGMNKTLGFVAKYANEWNAVFQNAEGFAERNTRLNELLAQQGRAPTDVRRSMMTGSLFGKDEAEVAQKLATATQSREQLRERGILVGTANDIVEQLGRLAEVGVQRVMVQWLELDDLDGLEAMANGVLPQVG
jgi:F420-dependent oxidoreductase-like protein